MMRASRRFLGIAILLACGVSAFGQEIPPAAVGDVDFAREIRPIFEKSCTICHGAKSQKGGLRLDRKADAFAGGDSGEVIEPGKGAESRLVRYVSGAEADHVMPPQKKKTAVDYRERLSADEIAKIRAWIDQGASWPDEAKKAEASDHWAFRKPVRPMVPSVKNAEWVKNPIDAFVMEKLEKEGLTPSTEADRVALIRRLSLDLIGLPPTIAEVDAFKNDARPDAYEKLVDRLLASPHFGERWTRRWLDKARYADTNGYEKDRERSIWPYRDWVINAFNADMPFDRFTIEQLAGDLLPNPTPDQIVATGFHRNTMRNEEGGIDVEEFRFASVVDRVGTTGSTWLGLTIACAQCHTHKYDPITQREYYQFFAFFNNTDEPEEYDIPDHVITAKRAEINAEIARRTERLIDSFPTVDSSLGWEAWVPQAAASSGGASLTIGPSGIVSASGALPEKDVYTIEINADLTDVDAIRLEAIADASDKAFGPGRTAHGNFVLTRFQAKIDGDDLPIASAIADFTQHDFDPSGTLDDNPRTGWAIDDARGRLDKTRAITFAIGKAAAGLSKLTITLDQQYGGSHTLARFRLLAHKPTPLPVGDEATLRRDRVATRQSAWEKSIKPAHWSIVAPSTVVSRKNATMTVLPDGSVLASGDKPNNDVYELEIPVSLPKITAIRLEVLTDASLPENGPGRAPLYSIGDFILTEFLATTISDDPKTPHPLKIATATEDFASPGHTAAMAIDGVPESGWTIQGSTGKTHSAVFEFAEPITDASNLALTLHQFGIHQTTLGRFRISVTSDALPVKATGLPAEVEDAVLIEAAKRSPEQASRVANHFLAIAPETAAARAEIDSLRKSMPKYRTSLVMVERRPEHSRTTNIHRRGEYFSLADAVEPGVPSVLSALPESASKNRLSLAKWIASPENPLTSRVAVNDLWQALFGRGLVATQEDFGTRGERPSHPELLDWLAVEFPDHVWSTKHILRLIVTSAAYRQSSKSSPDQIARDPKNLLLARGARFRVDAETVRDIALTASGLINPKIGGPGVYPPQPDGVTALSYGQMSWPTSQGADRYRRGLYTYVKRTAPFAAFSLMDAPSSETACVRRERSNTPLQALTLLNDPAYMEAARALAKRACSESPANASRLVLIFRACLSRDPNAEEMQLLSAFYEQQLKRFRDNQLDPKKLAGDSSDLTDPSELAAWVAVARSIMNLDETITRG